MSALIERNFKFLAGVYFHEEFIINDYDFNLSLEVNTDSIREQNVSMERIKYLIHDRLENSIFINMNEKRTIENYTKCGLNVCTIPEDPYDQIIALVLLLKFDAIIENKLSVTDIEFTSRLSDGVIFKESITTAKDSFKEHGWWLDSSPNIVSYNKINKKEKIVELINSPDWKDIGLSWSEKTNTVEIKFSTVEDITNRNK